MNQKELDRLKAEQPDHKHAFEMKEGGSTLLSAARHALEDLQALDRGEATIEEVSGVIIELRNAIKREERKCLK